MAGLAWHGPIVYYTLLSVFMCYLCDIAQQATSNEAESICNLTKNRNTFSCVMHGNSTISLKVAIIGSLAQSAPLYFLAIPVKDGALYHYENSSQSNW